MNKKNVSAPKQTASFSCAVPREEDRPGDSRKKLRVFQTAAARLMQGYIVGVANIIPGISGGTLALVLGIYPRLLKALANLDAAALRSLLRASTLRRGCGEALQSTLRRVDAVFLVLLGLGAAAAVLSLSRLMTLLLHTRLLETYAFFFGLIMASVVFPYRLLRKRGGLETAVCLAAAALTIALTLSVDEERVMQRASRKAAVLAQASAENAGHAVEITGVSKTAARITLRFPSAGDAARVFAGGALAFAAMILPGVSGSFILLLMGVYFILLRAVNEGNVVLAVVFIAGGMFGLLTLARIVSACLRRRFDATMAAMIGLMLGSLWGLWPFKRYLILADDLIILGNRLPVQASEIFMAAILFIAAVALVSGLLCLEKRYAAE